MVYFPKKEVRRQLFHMFFGIVIVFLLAFDILNMISLPAVLVAAILICVLSRREKIPGIYWFFEKFEREEDLIRFPGKGALFYLISASVVVLLFEKDIAMASVMVLALGDSVSHLIGKFGSVKHPFTDKKFLEGSIAGIIAAFIGAFLILNNSMEAGAASIIGMVVEGLDIKFKQKKINDNLLIPIVSGLVVWLIRVIPAFI